MFSIPQGRGCSVLLSVVGISLHLFHLKCGDWTLCNLKILENCGLLGKTSGGHAKGGGKTRLKSGRSGQLNAESKRTEKRAEAFIY